MRERYRQAYSDTWTELLTCPESNRDELVFILNFLQPLCSSSPCGEDFLEWAMRNLPFFAKMQPKYRGMDPVEYLIKRQQEITENLKQLREKNEK